MPLRLCVISENRTLLGKRRAIKFSACGGTIGRAKDNDWVLPDPKRYVSGRHALIDYQSGAYYLVDTSRNGVYVNGADTPVGKGHPQRLFDGDQIRVGDFDVLVEIAESADEAQNDDMADSVVRAQQVQEDESMELMLVDEQKLVEEDDALARHVATEALGQTSQISERLPKLTSKKGPPPVRKSPAPAAKTDGLAIAAFMEAAGLTASDLAGNSPQNVLRAAGQLLQLMTGGLVDLLRNRAEVKDEFRMSQTIIKGEQNNPLKFSASVQDALKYLLGNSSASYLTPRKAVEATFEDLKSHEQAMNKAMAQALKDYLDRFDPDELRNQYDLGLKRIPLLASANKLKYWDLYAESYHILTYGEEGKLPEAFSQEFARAYEIEIESMKVARPTGAPAEQ